ncbi:MAG TPA: LuxR C-terminal-related transcriptional regulator [Candidatus Limnocylindrales bacterium]|nr:LuxR C-terminal-related transcriptional regulator [Candidatus Limnocylindrales bacterium]
MPGRVVSRRFIGREPELARIADALATAAAGTATTVIVGGGAGMGVSRFLDEALGRAAASVDSPLILRGRAHGPADPPWAAVLEALEPALVTRPPNEILALLQRDAGPILRELPALAHRVEGAPGPRVSALSDPERRQPRALEALLRWLGRLADERPIVIALEDLHVADAATRSFATFVARIARQERIALVLSYQPDRLTREHPLRENLAVIEAGLRPPVHVDLAPFARRDIAGLIEGIEGERPSASIVVLVAERSAGSPLVVEELVAARRELRNATLTGTLADLVSARLARRSPECRRFLRLIAPAERPISLERLAIASATFEAVGATRLPPRSSTLPRRGTEVLDADLLAGLTEAIEHGFVHRGEDGLVGVRHELVARAIVSDLLPSQRPRYRAALASAFPDHPTIAAAFWRGAHRLEEAREVAIEAGRLAMRVEAPQDALAALERGLDLPAPGDADAGTAVELAQLAAEAAYAAMRPTRAVAYAESALGALGERRDRLGHAVLEARLGRYRMAAGDPTGATAALRRAAEVVPPEPSVERARILALLAQERMIGAAFRDAERAALEALEVTAAVGPAAEPEAIHATTTLAVVHGWGDQPESALPLLRDAAARAREAGLVEEWWRAVANEAVVLELLGRPAEAVDVTFASMAEARELDLDAVYGNLLGGNVAGILVDVGRWREARELSLRALDWSPAGVPFVNAILNLVLVEIESEAGEEAGRLLGRILVELETGGDLQFAVPAYQATASYAMWSGDLADARRAAERGWARLRGTEDWVLVARMAATAMEVESAIVADALERRRIGDVAASRERASRILAEAEGAVARARSEDGAGTGEPEASLATARAFHARLAGRDDPARWADLARRWAAIGDPYREARARWRQAEAIMGGAIAGPGGVRDRTDARLVRADARDPLLEAVTLAMGLGARPLLRRLRELAGRAMIALPPEVETLLERPAATPVGPRAQVAPGPVGDMTTPAPAWAQTGRGAGGGSGDTFGLSKRELEVLGLIAQGRTNREIGDRLFISQKTVGVHVGNILAKLGVSGRVEAAAVAIRLGLEAGGTGTPRGR